PPAQMAGHGHPAQLGERGRVPALPPVGRGHGRAPTPRPGLRARRLARGRRRALVRRPLRARQPDRQPAEHYRRSGLRPGGARGALEGLAGRQAKEMDDWRDAEPGKMPHEMRIGELAHFGRIPHTPYYGTADATPLYLVVLHEAWKWLGDDTLLRQYRDVAL